jgi:hypothetical protein
MGMGVTVGQRRDRTRMNPLTRRRIATLGHQTYCLYARRPIAAPGLVSESPSHTPDAGRVCAKVTTR